MNGRPVLAPSPLIATALTIHKAALIPFVTDRVSDAGHDPVAGLPPSSPIVKRGFDFDARAAWKLLTDHSDLFFDTQAISSQKSRLRELSRLRDRWAHQQTLKDNDARRFCELGSQLLRDLGRKPEARALSLLAKPFDADLAEQINWLLESQQIILPADRDSMLVALHLDDGLEGQARFRRALVHQAALSELGVTETAPVALELTETSADIPGEEHGLPESTFWWLLGLAHDAPIELRTTAWKSR
ncbi:MAG: hypothetical protein CMK06_09140 [Ponticaulis sp.]|nr:hypothetical protein [Ponticaulis sp.]|tara:strand:- start:12220 stop:12954 length:735 start_codon:yes stop_codon:yes gene_type:complete